MHIVLFNFMDRDSDVAKQNSLNRNGKGELSRNFNDEKIVENKMAIEPFFSKTSLTSLP